MQQFYLLGSQRVTEKAYPCYVAAWSVEARNEVFSDGIVASRKYNWHGRSHGLRRGCCSDVADDHSDLSADQLGYQPRQLIIATLRRAKFDQHRRLLRSRRERPRCRLTAEQRDELAAASCGTWGLPPAQERPSATDGPLRSVYRTLCLPRALSPHR
jgi:hypothetical protein